ncbi:MAG TPA: hydrogenase expression/formation protein HypE [Gemmatimonadaceae bacterium]
MTSVMTSGAACPVPLVATDRVQLGHGSGGKMSAALLKEHFLPLFDNPVLRQLGDAGVVRLPRGEVAMSTDTFVVSPLLFPGGNIGSLAVHGTLNDLAMMGAVPQYLTCGFILEEGLPFETLDLAVAAMAEASRENGVPIVAGDTKVVERGRADGLYINTAGIGIIDPAFRPRPEAVRPGDVLLISGPIAQHGMAIMSAREGLEFEAQIESDTASLTPLVELLRKQVGGAVHAMRDPTRGGVASALNELAAASGVGVTLEESSVVVPPAAAAACEMLGLDPLYVANEGVLVAFVAPEHAERALAALRSHPLGARATIAGQAVAENAGLVVLRTRIGSRRVVDMLPGDQLPRIC